MTDINRAKVTDVVQKVRNLQALTRISGTITTRAQGVLLRALNDEELTYAAELLAEQNERTSERTSEGHNANPKR